MSQKAVTATVDAETQAQWICAFNSIDTSGDGYLQRSELVAVLKSVGQDPSMKQVDEMCSAVGFKQEFDENGEETNGMDIDQFITMMAIQQKHARDGTATMDPAMAQAFNNERMADLANRNKFVPKKRDADFDAMDKTAAKLRCINCRQNFTEAENTEESCQFHPGPMKSEGGRTRNDLDKTMFMCCGQEQIGNSPVLYAPPGCKTQKHVAKEG